MTGGYNYGASLGNYPGTSYGTPWNNARSIGAGTSSVPYGYGVPGFGKSPIRILQQYLQYLGNAGILPGYIPGSGTYNQFPLNQEGLIGQVAGQATNLRYGLGGTGDPTTGREEQTPEEWVKGSPLFEWQLHNQGKLPRDVGKDFLVTLFMRSDTPSGIGTPTWSAPEQFWQGLYQAIAEGQVAPTERGWQLLATKGVTPQNVAARGGTGTTDTNVTTATGAASGGQATGAAGTRTGATTTTTTTAAAGAGSQEDEAIRDALASIAASQAADQAARLAYQEWQMRTGDEQLAMQKAQQAWAQTFQQAQQAWTQQYQTAGLTGTLNGQQTQQAQQQAFAQQLARDELAFQREQAALQERLAEAGLLGTYEGQQTQQAQQQAWAQRFAQEQLGQQGALGVLGLQSQLQGPRDWARYWQLNASAPEGLRSAVQSLAGRYNFAPGAQGTPGPATLGSRTQDLLSGGQQGTGGAATGAGQAGNAWGWDLKNWGQMSPSMQQGVLGAAEAGGAYGPDIERLLAQAAPRYVGPATAAVGL
jgi:hypothetical protein